MTATSLKTFLIQNKHSIFTFLCVGALTSLLYFGLFGLFWKILTINYSIAVSMAYVLSIIFYFFSNRMFTFKSQAQPVSGQFIKFIGMAILNYVITLIVVYTSVELLTLPPYIGMVFAVGTTTILSYIIAKFWVFRIKNQGEL